MSILCRFGLHRRFRSARLWRCWGCRSLWAERYDLDRDRSWWEKVR